MSHKLFVIKWQVRNQTRESVGNIRTYSMYCTYPRDARHTYYVLHTGTVHMYWKLQTANCKLQTANCNYVTYKK